MSMRKLTLRKIVTSHTVVVITEMTLPWLLMMTSLSSRRQRLRKKPQELCHSLLRKINRLIGVVSRDSVVGIATGYGTLKELNITFRERPTIRSNLSPVK
jgi:hypothetical protein